MTEEAFRALLDKYLAGSATDEEIEQIRQFETHFLSNSASVFDSDEQRAQVRQELYERIKPKSQSSVDWRGMVAAVALLAVFGLGTWWLNDHVFASGLVQYETAQGERQVVTLADGSEVHLNANSSLEYPAQFGDGKRSVILRGEAYFKVVKDSAHPFEVTAGGIVVSVLGTEFNFSAYAIDSAASVSLVEGAVRAEGLGSSQILAPSEQLNFDLTSEVVSKSTFSPHDATAWLSGGLVFDRTPLSRVAKVMERQFGIAVRFEKQDLKAFTISGRFDDPTPELVLASVTAAKGLRYKKVSEQEVLVYQPQSEK